MLSTIGIVLDVVVVCAIVIALILGFKKGFLKSVLDFFSWVVCLIVAVILAKYVARLINGIYDFAGLIGNKIAGGLNGEYFNTPINEMGYEDKAAFIANIPSGTNGLLTQIIKAVINSSKFSLESTKTVGSVVGSSIGSVSMVIISGILVFIVLKLVVFILTKIFNKIASTKVLGTLNRILGGVFGVLKAGCVIVIFNFVLCLLTLIPFVNKTVKPLIQDNTHVEKVIYNTTDKLTEKYIIDGKLIQTWITTLWDNK